MMELFSVTKAAKMVPCSRNTLYRYRDMGLLSMVRRGKRHYVKSDYLARWAPLARMYIRLKMRRGFILMRGFSPVKTGERRIK